MNKIIRFPNIDLARFEKKVIRLTTSIKADLINLAEKRNELLKVQKELRKLQAKARLKVVKNELESDPRT